MPSQEDLDRINLDYEDEFEDESSREEILGSLINNIKEFYKEEIKKIREG